MVSKPISVEALNNVLNRGDDPNDILLLIKLEDPVVALYLDSFLGELPSRETRGAALIVATTIWAASKEQNKLDSEGSA